MELVFDLCGTQPMEVTQVQRKTFSQNGGVIGRHADCEWILIDCAQTVSKYHAEISYRDGAFFIRDISTNGIALNRTKKYLTKGQAKRIEHGHVFALGNFEIRAHLEHERLERLEQVGRPQPAGSIIPDDAFQNRDLLDPVEPPAQAFSILDEPSVRPGSFLSTEPQVGCARIDYENLSVPQLVAAPEPELPVAYTPPEAPCTDAFWNDFGTVLGIDLLAMTQADREALALKAAHLLKQSIGGLQQSVWTRSELKNELRLARTVAPATRQNPLTSTHDAQEALGLLLAPQKPHQRPAEHVIWRAFHDLQAHQMALLNASRAAVRSSLEHFSPQQLTLRFERDGHQSWFTTSGSRWRAFSRYHQALQQDNDWCERLLARDFAQAYDEQVRLISTLHTQG